MAEKRIDIIIGARNASDAAFAQASASAKKFQTDISAADAATVKFGLSMGRMSFAFGVINGAAKIGSAAIRVWEGDLSTAVDEIEKLPFGIGAAAKALHEFLGLATGTTQEIEKLTEAGKVQDETFQKLLSKQQKGLTDVNRILDEALTAAGRRDGVEKLQHDAKIKRLEEIAKLTPALAEKAAQAVEAINAAQFARDLKRQEEQAMEREEQEKRLAKSLEDLDAEIRQKSLEAQGKTLDAELDRIREHYRRRIEEAETGAERERLIKLRALDEEEAKRRDLERLKSAATKTDSPAAAAAVAGRSGIGAVSVGGSFLGLQARFAGGQDPASDTAKNTKKTVTVLESLVKKLDESLNRPIQLDARVVRA